MAAIAEDHPVKAPGTQFNYSDVNFITLGEIVHRVSHMPLDVFCKREVFGPMGMKDTSFLPSPALKPRIAPTTTRGADCAGAWCPIPLRITWAGWPVMPASLPRPMTWPSWPKCSSMARDSGQTYSQRRGGCGHDQSAAPPGHLHAARPRLGHPVALQPGVQRRLPRKVLSGTPAIPAPPCGSIPARRRL